jgi:putative NADPH-quinone reductase
VVFCHPRTDSYGAHLRDRVVAGLPTARLIDLYAGEELPGPPSGREHLIWAEAVVFVYPTWWSAMPAPLIGWVESMLEERGAFAHIRRMAVVTTHGSGRLVNTLEGGVGRRMVLGGLRRMAAPDCRARFIALYGIDRISDARRRRFADGVAARVQRVLN